MRAVCRNTKPHEIEKDADEPSPNVTVEEVWCMAVQETVDGGHCDCLEKHDVISEHHEKSKIRKVITGKVVTKIALDEQDSDEGQRSKHERARAERVDQKLAQGMLQEFVMSMLLNQQLEQENMK